MLLFETRYPVQSARELVASGAKLLDVRTQPEFAAGHLEGAKNIPLRDLPGRLGELGAKDRAIVVYCRSGRRSAEAAALLSAHGFAYVRDLGSMDNWLK